MRRFLFILIPVILLLVLLLLLFREMGTPDVIEIRSDDNRVRLEIPREALIVETDADTINIVALDPAVAEPVKGLPQPLFAYRLEPEGLRFRQPVRFSVDPGFWGRRQLPMLLHRTATHLEPLRLDTRLSDDRVDSVTTELQHFSEVLGFLSVLSVRIDDPGDQPMDSVFYVNASAGVAPGEIVKFQPSPDGTFWTLQRVDSPVNLSNGGFSAAGTLDPVSVDGKPAAVAINPANRHSEFAGFSCTAESAGNRISYQVQAAYTLLLSSADNPNRVVPVPIDDSITVQGDPFACLPPAPAPDVFSTVDFPLDAVETFYAEISKSPAGPITVGRDFTLKARVGHFYDGAGTPQAAQWELKHGRFEVVAMHGGQTISPFRIGNLPDTATLAANDSWSGDATFRCMEAGGAIINYEGLVYYTAPGNTGNGRISVAVTAQAAVECIADPSGADFNALAGSELLGPLQDQESGTLSGFQLLWWREPASERLWIGESFTVRAELLNLRNPDPPPAAWRLSGHLSSTGNVLSPAGYDAPVPVSLMPGGTWWGNYQFTCRNAGSTTLTHNITVESPDGPLALSVYDTSLECMGD